eukprot:756141-Hanusia_phi.AAC.4
MKTLCLDRSSHSVNLTVPGRAGHTSPESGPAGSGLTVRQLRSLYRYISLNSMAALARERRKDRWQEGTERREGSGREEEGRQKNVRQEDEP